MSDNTTNSIQLLNEKIKGIRIAMLTTTEQDGTLHSRPMATQEMDADGVLWFFTYADAPKVEDVAQQSQVNVSYSKPDDNLFVKDSSPFFLSFCIALLALSTLFKAAFTG